MKKAMKKVLLIAHLNTEESDNGRVLYIASQLANDGIDVELVTSSFSHRDKKLKKQNLAKWPFKITLIDEPGYNNNVGLRRLYSHYIWGKNLKKYLAGHSIPDLVYCEVPSLSGSVVTAEFCKRNGIKFIIDVFDLWPEAFSMVFNIPIISDLIYKPFTYMANKIYSAADEVFAVSQTFVNRVVSVNKKCDAGRCVYLGTDIETFMNNVRSNPVTDKPCGEIWIGYCGTLGYSYDLKCVMDAMILLRKQSIRLPAFIVMGDGPLKEEFEEYASINNLPVHFMGWIAYEKMCGILCACDIVVNPILAGSRGSIINKHADYAASGHPVINTQECQEYRELVEKYEMGINCGCGSSIEVANAIIRLINDENLRHKMGENALRCSEECFDRRLIYKPFIDSLER